MKTHTKLLETEVAQTSSNDIAPSGTLPGKSEVNPGAHCIVISILESGNTEEVAYDGSIDPGPMVPKNAQVSGFERVFVPRTPRFAVPHHLKESISERTLA